VVIATDDYELYRRERSGFLQIVTGHLVGLHMLFLGFGFRDPNIAHLLGLIRESTGDHATEHYAVVRRPSRATEAGPNAPLEYQRARHRHWVADMQRYGINCVEVDEYDEVTDILRDVEAAVARRSVFVSGSYPEDRRGPDREKIEGIAKGVGDLLGRRHLRLVSGFGLTVGTAVVGGVLGAIYAEPVPALERSLLLRPFPQVIPPGFERAAFQKRYREDMIRQAGVCIFVGGLRRSDAGLEVAPGVLEEFEIARASGRVLIPVRSSGGASEVIWNRIDELG